MTTTFVVCRATTLAAAGGASFLQPGPRDDDLTPVQIMLAQEEEGLELRHDVVWRDPERHVVTVRDDMLDALPFLAAPNAIGYHRARARTVTAYERLRPITWAEVGISDGRTALEYERHRVRPEDLQRAHDSCIVGMNRIVSVFGMPADDEWVSPGG